MHLDKNIVIGSGAAIVAIVGLYFAMKSGTSDEPVNNVASTGNGVGYGYSAYSTIGAGANSVPVSAGAVSVNSSQTGDLTSVLQTQAETQRLATIGQINANVLNSITASAATVLARGADLTGRANGTLELNYDQQSTINGVPNLTGGIDTTSPITTQMTAHLTETVPDQHYAPAPPAPVIVTPPAPVVQKSSGGSKGLCFITTAICKLEGLPDNCETLNIFRKFRDTYMMETPLRKSLVDFYYQLAPLVDGKLSDDQLLFLKQNYLDQALIAINAGHEWVAFNIYCDMLIAAIKLVNGAS